jgi:biofilm PGA synthesis N-glycosyltransferase PgaC
VKIVALIPAHNEENTIAMTIESLQDQMWTPDHIIVLANNCTDGNWPSA